MRTASLLFAVLLFSCLAACSVSPSPVVASASVPEAPTASPAAGPQLDCPACKVIIDYGALQAAAADMEKSAYGAWEAVLKGYESGALTWKDIEGDVYKACEQAKQIRAWAAEMEKRVRELSLRSTPAAER